MTRHLLLTATMAGTLALAACDGADIVNALTPDDGYTLERDVAYGPLERQRLDVYRPDTMADDTPVVVFFYGGGWETGARQDYRFVGQAFAARGYVTVVPDYRLYPEVRYPSFVEDAAAAVAWVRSRRDTAGWPATGPVFLVGHSAGAYIAAMLTLDGRWLERAGAPVCRTVAATVGLAGPYDFLPLKDPTLMEIFGPVETRPATQPTAYVTGAQPPMLLITGDDDTTVRPRNTHRLAARIEQAGGRVEKRIYEGRGHIILVGALSTLLRGRAPVLDDVTGFIERYRSAEAAGCSVQDQGR